MNKSGFHLNSMSLHLHGSLSHHRGSDRVECSSRRWSSILVAPNLTCLGSDEAEQAGPEMYRSVGSAWAAGLLVCKATEVTGTCAGKLT